MKILVINGPNINLLGLRETNIYGVQNYQALLNFINESAIEIGVEVECFQSNHEGMIVDKIQVAYNNFDGIIINPSAYTHTSIAILDALKAVSIPTVEVHISNINERENFRQISYTQLACIKTIIGLGFESYRQAILFLKQYLES